MKGFFKLRLVLTLVALVLLVTAFAASLTHIAHSRAAGTSSPSGERLLGQSTLEPVYDDTTGNVTYIMTPNNAPNFPVKSNPASWAPFYVVAYPVGVSFGPLQCAHIPADNCPPTGQVIAQIAAATIPAVYGPADGSGVAGHEHLMAPPGSGGDFNVAWEPFLVFFTSTAAVTHLTTLTQLNAALASGAAIKVERPDLTFLCEVVSANVYAHATPVTPV